jgi:hypothetical protein
VSRAIKKIVGEDEKWYYKTRPHNILFATLFALSRVSNVCKAYKHLKKLSILVILEKKGFAVTQL